MNNVKLVLEDGKVFYGKSFGSGDEAVGEVVFNTGMTGYQEILTDPSYSGQIVAMTYPLIGNYGVNGEDVESGGIRVKGFIVKEYCDLAGNWKQTDNLGNYLKSNRIPGIYGVDTRALTRYLRNKGTMKGVIASAEENDGVMAAKARNMDCDAECSSMHAGTQKAYFIPGTGYRVTVLDFGMKKNILRYLTGMNCAVTVLPGNSSAADIFNTQCDGVLLSNGPGDPEILTEQVEAVRQLLGKKPIFGICLGHQVLGLALKGKTYKLTFGHRGVNHPVKDLRSGRVYITSQNHGYAIDKDSLNSSEVEITHINLNDQTIEGIQHKYLPVFSVQYHPEAAPGPQESKYLFDQFLENIRLNCTNKGGQGYAIG